MTERKAAAKTTAGLSTFRRDLADDFDGTDFADVVAVSPIRRDDLERLPRARVFSCTAIQHCLFSSQTVLNVRFIRRRRVITHASAYGHKNRRHASDL